MVTTPTKFYCGQNDTPVQLATFQTVSDGKKIVANAITDKGIETAEDATFATMADNIGKLSTSSYVGGIMEVEISTGTIKAGDMVVLHPRRHVYDNGYEDSSILINNRIYAIYGSTWADVLLTAIDNNGKFKTKIKVHTYNYYYNITVKNNNICKVINSQGNGSTSYYKFTGDDWVDSTEAEYSSAEALPQASNVYQSSTLVDTTFRWYTGIFGITHLSDNKPAGLLGFHGGTSDKKQYYHTSGIFTFDTPNGETYIHKITPVSQSQSAIMIYGIDSNNQVCPTMAKPITDTTVVSSIQNDAIPFIGKAITGGTAGETITVQNYGLINTSHNFLV